MVPELIPVSTPVLLLMAATDGSALIHVPPGELLPSVAEDPMHTFEAPVISEEPGVVSTVSFHATLVGQP